MTVPAPQRNGKASEGASAPLTVLADALKKPLDGAGTVPLLILAGAIWFGLSGLSAQLGELSRDQREAVRELQRLRESIDRMRVSYDSEKTNAQIPTFLDAGPVSGGDADRSWMLDRPDGSGDVRPAVRRDGG